MDLFRPNWLGEYIMALTYREYWAQTENIRKNEARKLWDWYFNDRVRILGYIESAMRKTFSIETLKKINIRVFNIVRRVVRKIAIINKLPTQRMLDGGKKVVVIDEGTPNASTKEIQSPADVQYQYALLHSTIARKEKEWRRLGLFFNTVIVQPVWVYDTENPDKPGFEPYMDFLIHTPAWTCVRPEPLNYLKIAELWYEINYTVDGREQNVLVYWSSKEHYMLTIQGAKLGVPGSAQGGGIIGGGDVVLQNNQFINPYGVLPFAIYRIDEANDFWGEGMWDLVEGNEEVCIQMSNLFYTALYQSHGERVAVNMGMSEGTIKTGPDVTHTRDNARQDGMQKPEMYFIHPDPPVEPIRHLIDWFMDGLQQLKGIAPQAYQIEQKVMTGIAKMMDAAELAEDRSEYTIIDQEFEYDLFDSFRTVWNYWNPMKKIAETAVFQAKAVEPRHPETIDEMIKRREAGLRNNWISRLDIIIEENPGITREEAEEKLEQIILEERRLKDKYGIMDLMPQPPGAPAQPQPQPQPAPANA